MTGEEAISVSRLAHKVDDLVEKVDGLSAGFNRVDEGLKNHINYTKASSEAETHRIDAILKANAEALHQANTEANESTVAANTQAERVATTLRELVETTRSAASKSQSEVINPIINRLNEIEQKQYENKGKEAVGDPALVTLTKSVNDLLESNALRKGTSAGSKEMWGYISGAIVLAGVIIGIIVRFL